MGRTRNSNVWLFRHDLPDGLAGDLEALCQSEPLAQSLRSPPRVAEATRAALRTHGPIIREYRGPAYLIPGSMRPTGEAVLITTENVGMLEAGFPWMIPHIKAGADIGPVTAVLVNGSAVSLCYCARLSSMAAEAGVETLEGVRRRGFATAAVSAWASAIRRRGLLPLYGTSWENVASQRVAEKLGAVCYGEDWETE